MTVVAVPQADSGKPRTVPTGGGRAGHARNVFANWGAFLVSVAISFLLSPYIVSRLGNTAYGIWVLLGSVVGYLGLLDLGIRSAVTRFVARHYAAADHHAASRIVSTALTLFGIAGLAVLLVAGGLATVITTAFELPRESWTDARLVVLLGGLSLATSLLGGVCGGVVVGLQRFDWTNAVDVSTEIGRAVTTYVVLATGHGIVALACVQLAASLVRATANYRLCRRLYPELRLRLGGLERPYVRQVLAFGVFSFLLQASGALMLYSDSLVIGALLPMQMITFFAIGANLTHYARLVISGISQTMTPLASFLQSQGRHAELRDVLLGSTRVATLVALPIVITLGLRGDTFIGLWMGPEYALPSGRVLSILSAALWFASAYQVVSTVMLGLDRHRALVPVFVAEACCNVALSVALVPDFGIEGVAWGTAIPRLLVTVLFGPWYVRRTLAVPIRAFWLSTWIRPSVAVMPFLLCSMLVDRIWPATSILLFFLQTLALLPAAIVGAWFVCLAPPEREGIARVLGRRWLTLGQALS